MSNKQVSSMTKTVLNHEINLTNSNKEHPAVSVNSHSIVK